MAVTGMADFVKTVERSTTAVTRDAKKKYALVAAAAYDAVCDITEETKSIDTGAYVARHRLTQGRKNIIEHPTRPSRRERYPSQKRIGEPPIFTNARRAGLPIEGVLIAQLKPRGFSIENDSTYAEYLEDGSTTIDPPRRIYKKAEKRTATFIRRIERDSR